jgi:hypothetical protein
LFGSGLAVASLACVEEPASSDHAADMVIDSTGAGAADPCAYSPLGAETDSVLLDPENAPCVIRAIDVGVRLNSSSDGSWPDPASQSVVRMSTGRLPTSSQPANNRTSGVLLAWSQNGQFEQSIGKPGPGPGEFFGRGILTMLVDRSDTVLVLDGAFRLSIFSPDLSFVRVGNAPALSPRPQTIHALADGAILSTGPVFNGAPDKWFHITGRDGRIRQSFGNASQPGLRHGEYSGLPPRRSAYLAGDTFWVAPVDGGEYVLEQWNLQGRRVRTLRRAAAWHKPDKEPDRFGRRFPQTLRFHVDADGLLWLTILVKDRRWYPVGSYDEEVANLEILYDQHFEVIDPKSNQVVVSGVLDHGVGSPLANFIPQSNFSYRSRTDSLGFVSIQLFRLELAAKR